MRDCENCKHRIMKVEVGKGTPPEHFWGCECCECEFEPTTKNNLGVDCIDREALLNSLDDFNKWCKDGRLQGSMFAVDVIKDMPTVTPQEPVIDKIRAEIENEWPLKKSPCGSYSCGLRRAIEIIDKYKAETEDT